MLLLPAEGQTEEAWKPSRMHIVCPELGSIAQKSTFTCPSETARKIQGNERLSIRNPIFTTGKKYYLIIAVQTITTLPILFRSTFDCKYSVVQQEKEKKCGH